MPISDAELQILIEKIALDHNWDLNAYKWPTLKRRIKARMVEKKCETPEKYYALIDSDPEEYKNLINALTVNYTQWFRDDSVWDLILDIMTKQAHDKSEVRIWSAGCATGEEAYSLAILAYKIKNFYSKKGHKVDFIIHATDVDEICIKAAREGVYETANVNISEEEIDHYFNRKGSKLAIKPEYKEMVTFSRLDLAKDHYPAKLDLILCRNVMIYFTKELQKIIFENFYYSMKKGAYLVTGKTEVMPVKTNSLFEIVDLEDRIFKKVN